ncbi:MAG: cell division protein SepF [Candidatus Reconcilbacillus cellulovorans]|uniref:Cell division protein SepF n=1 Tax=Candidatus Reconcilbacillus cellulovorans TaxID=1906605 RepID=A0A2A6E4S8_9BACL|nr:MAG: cell division protein SepF [Candidatus Reconcilbacillus cellulovorans]
MGWISRFMNLVGIYDENDLDERERGGTDAEEPELSATEWRRTSRGHIVSIHAQKNVRVILSEPRSYDEVQEIADHLRFRRPVVVNLQRVRPDQAVRIVDFLSGTVYALNGGISKIGPNIFLCTPDTVEIQGAITEMLDEEPEYDRSR